MPRSSRPHQEAGGGAAPINPFSTTTSLSLVTTYPERILRHNISDEELDMLCESKKDFILEFLWAAIGALAGAAPGAIVSIHAFATSKEGFILRGEDLAQIAIFWSAIAVIAVAGTVSFSRERRAKSLQRQIRERSG
jgi:hypothetical protein